MEEKETPTMIPQHNVEEAERMVLGSVLSKNSLLDEITSIIEPRDFALPTHKLLWETINHMYEENNKVDIVDLTRAVITFNRMDDIKGGVEYLHNMVLEVLSPDHAVGYARIIKQYSVKRRVAEAAEMITRITEEHDSDSDEELYRKVEAIADTIRPSNSRSGNSLLRDRRKAYEDYLETREDFIPTGFRQMDVWMNGLARGWLYVLAARPSVGKTAKMLSMALNIARSGNGAVVIFSQEMPGETLQNRMLSNMTEIPMTKFRNKDLTLPERMRIRESLDELDSLPIHIFDRKQFSIDEVRTHCREIKRKEGKVAAIFVDYLGIMNIPQERGMTYSQCVGQVTTKAKGLALELHCSFVMLAQLNRETEKYAEPSLSHLRDSGSIEQDADVVEFLYEGEKDEHNPFEKNVISLIAKGRDVGINQFKLKFKGWIQQFEEVKK
jgi:replicative DNA helicase